MGLINSFHFKIFLQLQVLVLWSSTVCGGYSPNVEISSRRISDHRFAPKIVFPEPASADKYDYLFSPILSRPPQQKLYFRKEYKFKPYLLKSKPNLRYNYRKIPDTLQVPVYVPHTNKHSLYQITQELLKKTQASIGIKYNDELPDPGIKPVTENIKDDIKYDFRTKTHYYEK